MSGQTYGPHGGQGCPTALDDITEPARAGDTMSVVFFREASPGRCECGQDVDAFDRPSHRCNLDIDWHGIRAREEEAAMQTRRSAVMGKLRGREGMAIMDEGNWPPPGADPPLRPDGGKDVARFEELLREQVLKEARDATCHYCKHGRALIRGGHEVEDEITGWAPCSATAIRELLAPPLLLLDPPLWPEERAQGKTYFQCPRCARVGEMAEFIPAGDPGQNTRECPNSRCRTILKVAR